jgi:hypothetical protein
MKLKLVSALVLANGYVVGRDTSGRRIRLDIAEVEVEVKVRRVTQKDKLGTMSDFWPTK